MKARYFIPAVCLFLATACNNSSESKAKKEDTTMNNMDHTMPASGTVPEIPAVPEGAKVFFKNLKDGATITSPFKLEMGTEIIKVDTANLVVAGSGHHHLFIDAEDSLAYGETVPKDSTHVHFGKGQTEYQMILSPGKHKLTLQMADGLHRSYGNKLATVINVTVR
ncbi:MAG: DUF4399 domain-containing protein [Chitinophagaceae bacterium]